MKFKTSIYLFLTAFLVTAGFPVATQAYPAYQANSDLVIVAPYATPVSGEGDMGTSDPGFREFITLGQKYRIRQNGTITRIRLYIGNSHYAPTSGVTGLYLKIWRKTGTNSYDLVGTSNNLAGSLVINSFNTFDLTLPITVQEGDYYGWRQEGTGLPLQDIVESGTTSYYTTNVEPATTGYSWESQASSGGVNYAVPIELYMTAPQAVFIGDSIIAGHNANRSFLESTATTDLGSTIEYHFSELTGYTYQNMGIGAQTTTQIAARFTADVINSHPRIVVIEGGTNDNLLGGDSAKATFLSNWTAMLDAAQDSSSVTTIVALKILPCSNITSGCSDAEQQVVDDWNSSLATLAAGYSKAIVVDASTYVGQFRTGGDAGNLWDIKTEYDSGDGVHYNSAGHAQIAQAIADSLPKPSAAFVNDFATWNGDNMAINYRLSQTGGSTNSNISQTASSGIEYSTDNLTWADATPGTGGDGLTGLSSTDSPGTLHTFVWNNAADIPNTEDSSVYLRIRPNDGNINASAWATSSVFGLYNAVPANVAASLKESEITLTVNSFSGDTSGSAGYYFSRAGANSGWIQTNSWKDSGLSCGQSYVYSVKYRNSVGAESGTASITKATGICGGLPPEAYWLPTEPVGGFSAVADEDISTTSSRFVNLHFNAGTDVTKIALSMSEDFNGVSQEDYQPTKQIDLCPSASGFVKKEICPDGQYTVYIKFYTRYGRSSEVLTKKIILVNSAATPAATATATKASKSSAVFTKNLKAGYSDSQVKLLQRFLNNSGFKLAASGAGSAGKETSYFGSLTKKALIRFQKANQNKVAGIAKELGYFGTATRALANTLYPTVFK